MTQLRPLDAVERSPTCQRSAPRLSDAVWRGTYGGNARVVSRNRVYFQIIIVKEASYDHCRRAGSRHCRIAGSNPAANQRRRPS